jgi:hypothetical protein
MSESSITVFKHKDGDRNEKSPLVLFFSKNRYLIFTLLVGLVAGLFTLIWSYQNSYITLYGDAKSHLNIARRVFDNLTPGIAQLGGSWLPLHHVLLLPFVYIDFLYRTGLAGSFVSFASYLLSIYFIFKIIFSLTNSEKTATFGGLLFALNSDVLYMQTTPMTELLTVFLITASIFYLLKWIQSNRIRYLLALALCLFFGSLTRYEIWSLIIAASAVLVITYITTNRISFRKFDKLEGRLILFWTLAFLGVGIWLVWNKLIFGNLFYFLSGAYSAKAYQTPLIKHGLNRPFHNIYYALLVYGFTTIDTTGFITVIFGFIGSIYYLLKKYSLYAMCFAGYCFTIFVFESYALYKGNTTIYVPQLFPFDYYNVRYGLYSIPFFIIFSSYLLTIKSKIFTFLIALLLILQTAYNLYYFHPITLVDNLVQQSPVFGDKYSREKSKKDAIYFFSKAYHGGLILISAGVFDEFIFSSNIDLKNFITEGTAKFWNSSLNYPTKYATYIVLNRRDEFNDVRSDLTFKMQRSHEFKNNFVLIFEEGLYQIYRKKT